MPIESAQISTGSPGTSRMTKRAPSVMGGGATVGTAAAHGLGAVPDALARRAVVADDAVREHVVAVADVDVRASAVAAA
jgi:hypothetical protein